MRQFKPKGRSIIHKVALISGLFAAALAVYYWVRMVFTNPYNGPVHSDVVFNTFVMVLLPACLAMASILIKKPLLMYGAFLLALPTGFYMALTPGIFKWYGVVLVLYLASAILMTLDSKARA